eukprot:1159258-Pelagomonas_calceolata.AAC.2
MMTSMPQGLHGIWCKSLVPPLPSHYITNPSLAPSPVGIHANKPYLWTNSSALGCGGCGGMTDGGDMRTIPSLVATV